jgi:hypothetical protein
MCGIHLTPHHCCGKGPLWQRQGVMGDSTPGPIRWIIVLKSCLEHAEPPSSLAMAIKGEGGKDAAPKLQSGKWARVRHPPSPQPFQQGAIVAHWRYKQET